MGADLYIQSIHTPNYDRVKPLFEAACQKRNQLDRESQSEQYDAAQTEVERYYEEMDSIGYFRDSYNATSLLHKLGLSWWANVGDMLNDEGNLQPDKVKELLALIVERESQFKEFIAAEDFSEWDDPRAEVIAYFEDKYERFKAFLQQAIDLDQPIYCSI